MTLKEAAEAYLACEELAREKLPYAAAVAVYLTRQRTAGPFRFYAEEEQKLIETYGERDEAGALVSQDGRTALKDPKTFFARKQELLETELPWEHAVIRCAAPAEIRPMQLAALAGLIEFEEGTA